MDDPYNLQRFIEAQEPVYAQVCAELRQGRKTGHWMWFIFPQIRGLGSSETAQYFAIASRQEATAYAAHPVLGPRLRECAALVLQIDNKSVEQIFGYPDNLKFHSSMTLFARTTEDNQVFLDALKKYFSAASDPQTLARL
ncbi:MAG TPA: DUF1810 domain-containing protein [Acidobacteriaceae bacterium]|nr:DUF1810 domain-containing protein [Acidobacteriaceae bacterium]